MRIVEGFSGLSRLFGEFSVGTTATVEMITIGCAKIIEKQVKNTYGKKTLLPPPLAEFTQEERSGLGFTPDKPLLRDGSIIRDSIHTEIIGPTEAKIGSDEPIAVYNEFGSINVLHGVFNPPRPVMKLAALRAEPKVAVFAQKTLGLLFTGSVIGRPTLDPYANEGEIMNAVGEDHYLNSDDGSTA